LSPVPQQGWLVCLGVPFVWINTPHIGERQMPAAAAEPARDPRKWIALTRKDPTKIVKMFHVPEFLVKTVTKWHY
jgi:hypothetical protein